MANTTNTIKNLTNLIFFNDKGQELYAQKDYVIEWSLVPCNEVSVYFHENVSGYFLAGIKYEEGSQTPVIDYTKLVTGFINSGGIYFDRNTYADILENLQDTYDTISVESYIKHIFFNINNDIELKINVDGKVYKYITNVNYIFDQRDFILKPNNTVVGNGDDNDSYELLSFESIGLQYVLDDNKQPVKDGNNNNIPVLYYAYLQQIDNLAILYPFVHYQISYMQDKVSSGLVAANALLILQKTSDGCCSPYLSSNEEHSIITFQTPVDSEVKLFETDNYELIYKSEESFDLADGNQNTVDPIVVNFCFNTDEEGVYQNYLGMYMRTKHDTNDVNNTFFFGAIIIKTEVEGEDERYRTLLGNFGIPDPVKYTRIFAEADYEDDGKDNILINNKSKELFLSYDQIFPYVGTYKALKNAVKFLGYGDIIFKEWYRIQDSNDQERDVAVQCIDSDGNYIKNTLSNYGISIEDFERYNKLNKLTMVYHINRLSAENEDMQELYLMEKNQITGKIENRGKLPVKNSINTYNTHDVVRDGELVQETYFDNYDIPTTEQIFTYSSDIVLAKLNSVKEWLEKHIIGVNAYIHEITGEGIYIHRFKNQSYVTEHSIQDFQSQAYYTPNIKEIYPFKMSTEILGCTLNEYSTVSFDDYKNTVIEDFEFNDLTLPYMADVSLLDISTLKLGNSFEAPVLGNEYSFKLEVQPESCTLKEFLEENNTYTYIADGEIDVLNNTVEPGYNIGDINTVTFNNNHNTTIEIEVGNIRRCFGKWNDNIQWMIREVIDQKSGDTYYELSNIGSKATASHIIHSRKYINVCIDPSINMNPAFPVSTTRLFLKYTSKNKWNLPMFMIKGFKFNPLLLTGLDEDKQDLYQMQSDDEYILEILKGRIIFSGYQSDNNMNYELGDINLKNTELTTSIIFDDKNESGEQNISVKYEYNTTTEPIVYTSVDGGIINTLRNQYTNNPSLKLLEQNNVKRNIMNSLNMLKNSDNEEALADYNTFQNSTPFTNSLKEFIQLQNTQERKKLLYSLFMQNYEDSYTFNDTINVAVNHLGDYDVYVNVYDKYNHIFCNKGLKTFNVFAKPIQYSIFLNQENSGNEQSFYHYNRNGELLANNELNDILRLQEDPLAPKSYRIYDIQHDYTDNTILYDNISYAIDTPKNNDWLIISNLSEIITSIDGNRKKLKMLDENPGKMNVFTIDTSINIVVYDNLMHEDISTYGPYNVTYSYKVDASTDINYEDDSYILLDTSVPSINIDNTGRYTLYAINVTKYPVEYENIENDYENNMSILKVDARAQLFNNGDVVKVIYEKQPYYNIQETIDRKMGIISNEVAYRVLDTYYKDGYAYIQLNGIVDTLLAEQDGIHTFISYPYRKSVHYGVKVVGDADEYSINVGYKGYRTQKVKFKYNEKKLLLNDYIDDTFSGYVYDFDFFDMKNLWFDANDIFTDESIYRYYDFPVTVEQGKHLMVYPDIGNQEFIDRIQYRWKWSTTILDDFDNNDDYINTYDNTVIMRSINNLLTIKADYLGVNNLEMQVIDSFGNRLVNKGEGKIYVKE